MSYRVELAPSAQRDLRRMPLRAQERLAAPILALGTEPRPTGARKVRGQARTWRIRVGPFRIVYDVHDDRNLVVGFKVARRGEPTYRL